MTNEQRARLIRMVTVGVIFSTAIAIGLVVDFGSEDGRRKKAAGQDLEEVTEENYKRMIAEENRLTVLNLVVEGNSESAKLSDVLEELQERKTFGKQVHYGAVNVSQRPTLATEEPVDPEKFSGQLDFYAAGKKLGSLKGKTDPVVVEETIRRYLRGLVKRFGPGWLPDVEGLEKGATTDGILQIQPADSKAP